MSRPLLPAAPPLAVPTMTNPLDVAVPSPVLKLMIPPVRIVLRPDAAKTPAPAPDVPLPAVTLIAPPLPSLDAPVPKARKPLFPFRDEPELNVKHPLEPPTPEFMLRTRTAPLLDAVPSPLAI
mmetsp:Transcript_5214/g.6687  ORF Transcript_5214/g.6687 Transcript_5214/m.6687 type:complete len:123 (-) Transcript_5214:394-762(-)